MSKIWRGKVQVDLRIKKEFGHLEEEKFIRDFIQSIPIDELKKLINFEVLDPTKDNPVDKQEREYYSGLMSKFIYEYRAEITI